MSVDATVRAIAKKTIARFGKSITLIRVTAGTYDATTSATVNTEASETIKAIVEDYSYQNSGQAFAAGLIQIGDKKVTVAASGLTQPNLGDKLVVDGNTFVIVNIKTTQVDLAALYEIQGRKA